MLLAYLAELYDAIRDRNELRVHVLLRAVDAGRIPTAVREEALVMVRLPAASMRAPMQLLMLLHRMEQLALDEGGQDEHEAPSFHDPDQLEIPLTRASGGER